MQECRRCLKFTSRRLAPDRFRNALIFARGAESIRAFFDGCSDLCLCCGRKQIPPWSLRSLVGMTNLRVKPLTRGCARSLIDFRCPLLITRCLLLSGQCSLTDFPVRTALALSCSYTKRFLPVQNLRNFFYLNSRNEAILKKLSDSSRQLPVDGAKKWFHHHAGGVVQAQSAVSR